jgi:hypothetical protein
LLQFGEAVFLPLDTRAGPPWEPAPVRPTATGAGAPGRSRWSVRAASSKTPLGVTGAEIHFPFFFASPSLTSWTKKNSSRLEN